jgi:2-polyprenyl-6-methoxyphenol hydroxylase-like FAD-dependent oxidoreductase
MEIAIVGGGIVGLGLALKPAPTRADLPNTLVTSQFCNV